jgi:hypothetical protein
MNIPELRQAGWDANPDTEIRLSHSPSGVWHSIRTVARYHWVGHDDYALDGWVTKLECSTHNGPHTCDPDKRVDAVIDPETFRGLLKTGYHQTKYMDRSICAGCLHWLTDRHSNSQEPIMTIDPTKPIIATNNGAIHQAAESTMAAAKAMAKQLIEDGTATTTTIYVPHTKLARPMPPVKAVRVTGYK